MTAAVLLGGLAIWIVPALYGGIFRAYTHTETGSYSDFAQTWVGTRIALLEHGDPYDPSVQPRIQEAYYGHALSPDDPHRPTHPQGFYYPLYLVALVWPLALVPFPLASALFKVLAVAILVCGTAGYLGLMGSSWASPRVRWAVALLASLTLGGQAVITADQPTVLLYGLLLGAVVAAGRSRFALAGVLLALTAIKPQLALVPALGMGIWLAGRPERRAGLGSAGVTLVALLAGSFAWQPGWMVSWAETFSGYAAATSGFGGWSQYGVGDWLGLGVRGAAVLGAVLLCWRARGQPLQNPAVVLALNATLVAATALQEPWFVYNLVFLYAPVMVLLAELRARSTHPQPPRGLGWIAVVVCAAPWAVYPLLLTVYALHPLPTDTLAWPSYAGLVLIAQRLLGDLAVVTVLFAYVAWGARALESAAPVGKPVPNRVQ
ncbi:MAG TPA: glycosyltransferase family 87 protein [Chloroflexia bacterium]|nr:glycosyltransferase family 87 protein [Chloroflexia bacterium]